MHCTNDEKRDGGCSVFGYCKHEDSADECLFYQSDNECSECGADFNFEDECACDEAEDFECGTCWGLFNECELDRNNECETCAENTENE
jgi:hypothetical protein